MKAYVLFGRDEIWKMFQSAYIGVQKYFRHSPWYHEADMRTGTATYWQLTSLQAFWPGLQVLVGDIEAANSSHREFFKVWKKYGVLPERTLFNNLGICWTIRCCILLKNTILYDLNWQSPHFTYIKQPKIHGIWKWVNQ
uniref:Alpha-1,2-Mannosidase n=1 Tax=Solanum tuberosum TaxID=4113 RepID=M1C9P5_SOLTU